MNINYRGDSEQSSLPLDVLERDELDDESLAFGPNDVLSGRHKLSFNHSTCTWCWKLCRSGSGCCCGLNDVVYCSFILVGNRRFREVVAQSIDDYNSAQCRAEKCGIVETIMSHVAASGGRFLKQDDDGNWQELEAETVRQKIAHAIRDTTKKRDAKIKKAIQRESVANKVAHRVMASSSTTAAVQEPPRQPAPNISRFVTNLNKHLEQQSTTVEPRAFGATAMPPLPVAAKDHKLDPEGQKLFQGGAGDGTGMNWPHAMRSELRQEPGQGMMTGMIGNEMRRDVGHRIKPTFGNEPGFCLSQRTSPVASLALEPPLGGPPASRQRMLPQMHVPLPAPIPTGHHPDFEIEPMASHDHNLAEHNVAQDDEFMAKIDDTLGPWQPDSEGHFH